MNKSYKNIFQNDSTYKYKFIYDDFHQTEGMKWNDEYIRLTKHIEEKDKEAMFLFSPLMMRADMTMLAMCSYLYIIYDDSIIIGCMICTTHGSNQEVNYVSIHPTYRNKGLCRIMIRIFIEELLKIREVKMFSLLNSGEIPACICYISAFKKHGYELKDDKNVNINIKERCSMKGPYRYDMEFIKKTQGGFQIRTVKNKKCRRRGTRHSSHGRSYRQ